MNRTIIIALTIFGALPLLVYPVVMMANIMSLAAGSDGVPVALFFWLFMISTTVYPLTYFAAVIYYFGFKRKERSVLLWPVWHLLLILVAMLGWAVFVQH